MKGYPRGISTGLKMAALGLNAKGKGMTITKMRRDIQKLMRCVKRYEHIHEFYIMRMLLNCIGSGFYIHLYVTAHKDKSIAGVISKPCQCEDIRYHLYCTSPFIILFSTYAESAQFKM